LSAKWLYRLFYGHFLYFGQKAVWDKMCSARIKKRAKKRGAISPEIGRGKRKSLTNP